MSLFRIKRVNEQVKRELSNLILQHLPVESYVLISVTEVEVARDLKTANVYISTVGATGHQAEEAILALKKIRAGLQHDLSRKITMKYTPQLLFKQDRGIERGQQMVKLLDALEKEQKA